MCRFGWQEPTHSCRWAARTAGGKADVVVRSPTTFELVVWAAAVQRVLSAPAELRTHGFAQLAIIRRVYACQPQSPVSRVLQTTPTADAAQSAC